MKPSLFFTVIATVFTPVAFAQPRLDPPPQDIVEAIDAEFQELEFDEFGSDELRPQDLRSNESNSSSPTVVGTNDNGVAEYSVLENRPNNLILDAAPNIESGNEKDQFEVSNELNQILTRLVLEHLPHEFNQDKKWGGQAKRWSGVNFRRDESDGKLETKRRYKMVNHGTWQKYSAELVDPNNQFAVELKNVSRNRGGDTTFDLHFDADLKIDARQAKWVKGVQLYSLGAEGAARVRLSVSCEMGVDMDLSQFPPELVMSPNVTRADIDLEEFKIHRVSKAGGELAQQVSRLARKELESKIHEKEKKLVKKLNNKIDANREKLRLSITEAIHLKWFDQTREFLPQDVQTAVSQSSPSPSSSMNNRSGRSAERHADAHNSSDHPTKR